MGQDTINADPGSIICLDFTGFAANKRVNYWEIRFGCWKAYAQDIFVPRLRKSRSGKALPPKKQREDSFVIYIALWSQLNYLTCSEASSESATISSAFLKLVELSSSSNEDEVNKICNKILIQCWKIALFFLKAYTEMCV